MAGIIERVNAIGLSTDDYIVIGSGLLEAWGLRTAGDVDLVASPQAFDALKRQGFLPAVKFDHDMLYKEDVEIWTEWSGVQFDPLRRDAIIVDGVPFVDPQFLIEWKKGRATAKDLNDITLLEDYLHDK